MSDERDRAVKFLTLPDADYADLKGKRLTEFQGNFGRLYSQNRGAPPAGTALLAIGAPKQADFESGTELPILVGLRYTGLRRWEVDPRQNALLIGVDLRSGAVFSGWPLVNDKRRPTPEPSRTGDPPEEEDATMLTTSVQNVDLRKGLEGKWGATRLALTAVIYDWVSNTVVIDLTKKGQEPAALAPRSASALLSRSKPGGEVPKLDGPGAALQVPTNVDPGDPAFLGGAVDLPAGEVVTVPSSAAEGGSLLAVSVVFRKLDDPQTLQADLLVPAQVADGRVRAFFEFDARRVDPEEHLSGVFQVYLVTGTRLAGPFVMKVEVR